MEYSPTVVETAAQTVKGLAALAAIPVVLFALWADYFGRYLQRARKSAPNFDPKIEREKVRLAAACVLLYEMVLTIGSMPTLQLYPKISSLGLLSCLFAVGIIQAGMEKQLIPILLKPLVTPQPGSPGSKPTRDSDASLQRAMNGSRALMFAVLSGFLYVVTLISFVKAAIWMSTALHFQTTWGAAFVMTAAAVGIFSGLTLNFAIAPWQMRHSIPVTPMSEETVAVISAPMKHAGLKNISYWIMDCPPATAAIAGFRWGSGIFRPALFVSRSALTALANEQLLAVVAHEAAHALAQHLRRRVLLSASLIVSLTFMAVFLALVSFTYFPDAGMQSSSGLFFGMIAFGLAFYVLQKQGRAHEFEADWIAIRKLGANFDDWASALRKLDQLNGLTTSVGPLSRYPRTEVRIQNVAKMLEFFAASGKAETTKAKDREDRAA